MNSATESSPSTWTSNAGEVAISIAQHHCVLYSFVFTPRLLLTFADGSFSNNIYLYLYTWLSISLYICTYLKKNKLTLWVHNKMIIIYVKTCDLICDLTWRQPQKSTHRCRYSTSYCIKHWTFSNCHPYFSLKGLIFCYFYI